MPGDRPTTSETPHRSGGLLSNPANLGIEGGRSVLYLPNFITVCCSTPRSLPLTPTLTSGRRRTIFNSEVLVQIQESPQPKWKNLQNRRLQIWGGEMTAKGTLCPAPFPNFVTQYPDLIARLKATEAFEGSPHGVPNHIIMNEYEAGQGIMPHEDGPKYHPVVATLSLGTHCVFHYYRYSDDASSTTPHGAENSGTGRSIDRTPVLSLLLEPRSLVISFGDMYTAHLHGIEDTFEDHIKSPVDLGGDSDSPANAVHIGNWDLLQDQKLKEMITRGEPLLRSTRWSLTCRDIPKVSTNLQRLRGF
ncbi:hypothetical protein DFP72DRAFT_912461 [Ephemerocybe angulata]|uniref:Fe2OG dioxygenase domain-containing protein n=1 Tax=Ephemerocybe angulata TaxID=980116 RepID=A0A8H6HPU5_9AGAR|nr:hypothetical protein DFP72DRAFT_912461 [Tulosesus angulatus]